jgi:acetyltransferase-like isoleucine patch superfamily enzyme
MYLSLVLLLSSGVPMTGFAMGSTVLEPSNVIINDEGKIQPPTAPITSQGNTYTLTGDLPNSNLNIQRSGITFNGVNFTVYGRITIESDYVTVANTTINSGGLGMLVNGSHSVIANNVFFHNLADISLNSGYATVAGNNDTGGAYRVFYVNSDYNNLTKNDLKGIEVGGNHNIVAENTLDYLFKGGKDNIYLNNIVDGKVETSTPQPTFPSFAFEIAAIIVTALVVFIAIAVFIYKRVTNKKSSKGKTANIINDLFPRLGVPTLYLISQESFD